MYKSKFNQQIIEAISWDGDNTKAGVIYWMRIYAL